MNRNSLGRGAIFAAVIALAISGRGVGVRLLTVTPVEPSLSIAPSHRVDGERRRISASWLCSVQKRATKRRRRRAARHAYMLVMPTTDAHPLCGR
jgi:hypothetical protein